MSYEPHLHCFGSLFGHCGLDDDCLHIRYGLPVQNEYPDVCPTKNLHDYSYRYIYRRGFPDYEQRNHTIHDYYPNSHLHHHVHNVGENYANENDEYVEDNDIPNHNTNQMRNTNMDDTTNWTDDIG